MLLSGDLAARNARVFTNMGKKLAANIRRGFREIGQAACSRAKWYAPKSPTRAMLRKMYRFGSRGGGKNRPRPGRLMQSIQWISDDRSATVFIGRSAPARAYAKRIHDEKGKTWWNRGAGTVAKGPQANEKFIERAVKDEYRNIMRHMRRGWRD